MKKIVVMFLVSFFIISCVSGPSSNIESTDKLIQNWAHGLEAKDIDTLMDSYWPEAVFTFIPPKGEEQVTSGIDDIRSLQMENMKNPTKVTVRVDTAESKKIGSTITYTLFVEVKDLSITNILELENRGHDWKIIRQVVKF